MFGPIAIGIGLLIAGYRSKHGGIIHPVKADQIYNVQEMAVGPGQSALVQMLKNPNSTAAQAAQIPVGTKVVTTGNAASGLLQFGDHVWIEVIVAPGQSGAGLKGYIKRYNLNGPYAEHSGLLAQLQ